MIKYTFLKDFDYTSYGFAPMPKTIKKGQSFNGIETADGIVISLNGGNPSDYKKEDLSPDQPSSFLTVPKEYLTQETFVQKHKTHLLIAGAIIVGFLAYKKFKK
jgi:hypothetical protein